jgi:hypothetical protein
VYVLGREELALCGDHSKELLMTTMVVWVLGGVILVSTVVWRYNGPMYVCMSVCVFIHVRIHVSITGYCNLPIFACMCVCMHTLRHIRIFHVHKYTCEKIYICKHVDTELFHSLVMCP